jgi:hypothetical protein
MNHTLFKRLISVSTSLAAISALNDFDEIVLIDFSNVLNPIRNFNKLDFMKNLDLKGCVLLLK